MHLLAQSFPEAMGLKLAEYAEQDPATRLDYIHRVLDKECQRQSTPICIQHDEAKVTFCGTFPGRLIVPSSSSELGLRATDHMITSSDVASFHEGMGYT